MKRNKIIFLFLITIILTLGLSVSLQSLLAAWTPPTVTAPGGNMSAPLNIGAVGQAKDSGLILNHLNIDANGLIVENGNVGIRTSNPGANLQINGDGNASTNEWATHPLKIWGADQSLSIGVDSSRHVSYLQSIDTGTVADSLILNPLGGNIGVGTLSPKYGVDFAGKFFHTGINSSAIPVSDNVNGGLIVGWNRTSGSAEVNLYNAFDLYGTGGLSFLFSQKTGASTYSDLMSIMGNGNVGIGVVYPTAKLQIGGVAGVDGIKFPDGTLQTTAAVTSGSATFVKYLTPGVYNYTFTKTGKVIVEIKGGGGAGGGNWGGGPSTNGGGGGGMQVLMDVTAGEVYRIEVGNGGIPYIYADASGYPGGDSSFSRIVSANSISLVAKGGQSGTGHNTAGNSGVCTTNLVGTFIGKADVLTLDESAKASFNNNKENRINNGGLSYDKSPTGLALPGGPGFVVITIY